MIHERHLQSEIVTAESTTENGRRPATPDLLDTLETGPAIVVGILRQRMRWSACLGRLQQEGRRPTSERQALRSGTTIAGRATITETREGPRAVWIETKSGTRSQSLRLPVDAILRLVSEWKPARLDEDRLGVKGDVGAKGTVGKRQKRTENMIEVSKEQRGGQDEMETRRGHQLEKEVLPTMTTPLDEALHRDVGGSSLFLFLSLSTCPSAQSSPLSRT